MLACKPTRPLFPSHDFLCHSSRWADTLSPRPISTGSKRDFAKPGVDALQQGFIYTSGSSSSGDKDRDHQNSTESSSQRQSSSSSKTLPELAYSSVGISLKSGRHRFKEDSRANYADVVEVDHEAQVMVIGDAARYFDRIRKNVNKAYMRQVLREALGPYCQRKKSESAAAGVKGWGNSAVSLTRVSGEDDQRHAEVDGGGGDEEQREPQEQQSEHGQADSEHGQADSELGAPPEHARPELVRSESAPAERARPEQVRSEHIRSDLVRPESLRSEHVLPQRVRPEHERPDHHRRSDHGRPEHRRPKLMRREYSDVPESPAATERDLEDFFSDTTRDEEDCEGSPRSPAYFTQPSPPQPSSSDERRARRAASRARGSPVMPSSEHTTGGRPGMDKAGLSSLRTLRQGLAGGGEEHDDTQSLRSLAMVGRSDSYTSSRSRG